MRPPLPLWIDAHTHLFPARLATAIRSFFLQQLPGAGDWDPFPYSTDVATCIDALRTAGVSQCWTLPYVRRPGAAAALNRWMAETFGDSDFVIPGATVHPGDDVAAVTAEALGGLGLRIVKLHCSVGDFDADDPRLSPLYERVSREGQPVVVHVGHSVHGTTEVSELAPLVRAAKRFPDVRFVLAHLGAPAVREGLELLASHRSVHADLTPVVFEAAVISRASIRGLEDRLLFGSDMPTVMMSLEAQRAHWKALELAPEHAAQIFGLNARRLISP